MNISRTTIPAFSDTKDAVASLKINDKTYYTVLRRLVKFWKEHHQEEDFQ